MSPDARPPSAPARAPAPPYANTAHMTSPGTITPAAPAPAPQPDTPRLTLIARHTALWLFTVLVACIGVIWWSEARVGLLADSDRLGYPLMMVWFAALIVLVWRRPAQLLLTQGLVTLGVGAYLVGTMAYALLIDGHMSVYAAASLAYWGMGAHLLFFLTWTALPALSLSLSVTLLCTLPALVVQLRGTPMPNWADVLWPLAINGFFAQILFALILFGISRQLRRLLRITPNQRSAPGAAFTVTDFVAHRLRDLEHARDAAEQASLAKSRFLAVMSHELRTPLHGVLGAAELLREPALSEAQRAELLTTIKHGGTHLLHLINDVLDLSRIEAGRVEIVHDVFDLHNCLSLVRESIQPQAQAKGLALKQRLVPKLPTHVRGDEFRIKQILLNLLGNAIKFTDTGSVTLEADYDRTRGELLLRIQDTGIGIAAPDQLRVFDAFQQADGGSTRRFGGTGLGLTITRQLVHLMSGRIVLDSEPGVGTRVQLQLPLPLSDTPTHEPPISTIASLTETLSGVRILLVDDDPINTMIAEQMLKSAGVITRAVHGGLDALSALSEGGFDLVLMDWLMPGMDGLEATRRLRAGVAGDAARALPVIGLTAHAFAEDRAACLQAGMDEVLVKPASKIQLLRTVQRVLETHRAEHAP